MGVPVTWDLCFMIKHEVKLPVLSYIVLSYMIGE